uniref:WAP domain-containing protein n=1 Tax=Gopherus evgoodei TaxID=1825980 RepID=A0A8C4WCZ3_9SAUR
MKPTELKLSCRNHLRVFIFLGLGRVRDTRELELSTQQAEITAWSLKPGTCPVVTCAMYNPPNRCHSDYQCPGFKKCCETFCGRACVYPKGHGKGTSLILSLGSVLRSLPALAEAGLNQSGLCS